MAALEAMSRGCIIIALKVGDLPKLITSGQNGYLVDTAAQIADVLRTLEQLTDDERQKISQQAICTVREQFSSSAVIPKLLQLYKNLVVNLILILRKTLS